jgi:hypothetical protein
MFSTKEEELLIKEFFRQDMMVTVMEVTTLAVTDEHLNTTSQTD